MTARITTDIFCDYCNSWMEEGGITDCKQKIRKARSKSHNFGWLTRLAENRVVDICPKCSENFVLSNQAKGNPHA